MSGRDPQSEGSDDNYTEKRRAAMNGTGRHPAISQGTGKYGAVPRPQSGKRIETSPMPRVARPRQEPTRPRRGRLLLILLGVFLAGALLACFLGNLFSHYLSSLNASSGAATAASNFLQSLSTQDYEQAYIDLGGNALEQQNLEHFKDMALQDDKCYGIIKDYQEVAGSGTVQGNTQSYSYTITRAKMSQPYQLHLTLQQGTNSPDNWKVISYGDDLGPAPPNC